MERKTLERLIAVNVVRETEDGRVWLDQDALAAYRRKRRGRALALVGGVLGAAAIAIGLSLA